MTIRRSILSSDGSTMKRQRLVRHSKQAIELTAEQRFMENT